MGRAIIRISPELLREWLSLPLTAVILGSRDSSAEVAVVVEDIGLPESPEGSLPTVAPIIKRNIPVEFVEWGPI